MSLLHNDVKFDVLITRALQENGTALWEEEHPAKKLEALKAISVVSFALQYQNDVSLAEQTVFKADQIQRWSNLPDSLDRYMAIDPAITKDSAHSDCTAIICIGVAQTGETYVVEYFKGRVLPDKAMDLCAEMYERNNPVLLAVEAVAFQRMLAIELGRRRVFGGKYMRVVEVRPDADKVRRILMLEPLYAAKKVFHPANSPELDEELMRFKPIPDKGYGVDDLLDSFSMAEKSVMWRRSAKTAAPPVGVRSTKHCGVF